MKMIVRDVKTLSLLLLIFRHNMMSAKLPIIKEPHPEPLPAGGEGS
jgi:hypothetical protein